MAGMMTMAKKEFLDIIGEKKFMLIFATLLIVILVSAYQGGLSYSESQSATGSITIPSGQGGGRPGNTTGTITQVFGSAQSLSRSLESMITNFSLVGAVLAIAISFDTINNERQRGSLKTMLSYPIYRDSIVYGKYLGGLLAVIMVSTVTFLGGMGLFVSVTGIEMTADTVARLAMFFGVSLVYMAIFLAIGLLLSIVLPSPSTSLLASMIVWLASIQLIPNIGYAIGQILYPVRMTFSGTGGPSFTQQTGFTTLRTIISGLSPSTAYENIVNSVLTTSSLEFTSGAPTVTSISVMNALITSLPSLLYFIGLLIVIFAAAYVVFMRQEIR
jgi:ABC-2 type transport system permease protein